ncbi:MAG: hypothetical protein ACREJU_19470, partial [Nitrospiraceae bacterium]
MTGPIQFYKSGECHHFTSLTSSERHDACPPFAPAHPNARLPSGEKICIKFETIIEFRPEQMTIQVLRHSPPNGIAFFLILAFLFPIGCQPDESPFKAENDTLRKQVAKQESVVVSLQEGNKVMQQQIDLLNRELRDAKEQVERVLTERTTLTKQLDAQEGKNRKLATEAQRVAEKASQLGQALKVDDKGGATGELPHPLPAVTKAAEEALARYGYAVRLSVKTEQKAVYVTDRKISAPASIEVAGFRNQYLVSIQAVSAGNSR